MKPRTFFSFLAAGAVTLLFIAGISIFWILGQSPLNLLKGGVNAYPQAAIFVSKQAPVMVSLLANPERLENLRQLAAPLNRRRRSRLELDEVKTSLLARTGLDYREDIRPWLGEEITLAVTSLDYDRNRDNGVQPGYLLVTQAKDPELAKEFLQLSYSEQALKGEIDLVFEAYKGVNLTYQRPVTSQTTGSKIFASAVVGDYVLFANHPRVLREAINNVQATELSLNNAAAYREALQAIEKPRVGLAFINLPAFSAWIGKAAIPETPEIEQMLTVELAIAPGGLVAETALFGVSDVENRQPVLSAPVEALAYLPDSSIFTVAGEDLEGFWQQLNDSLKPNSPLGQLVRRTVASLQESLGIDLPQDIFAWVRGEYVLALLAEPNGKGDWLFVAETKDKELATKAIANLDELATEKGLSVGNFAVEDTNVTAWTKLQTSSGKNLVSLNAEVRGTHARVGEYEILATSIEAISAALDKGNDSLLQNQGFQQAISALPLNNDGYLYIDWQQGKEFFEDKVPLVRVIELSAQSLFTHLRSLTLSSQGTENSIRHATVFFNLQA